MNILGISCFYHDSAAALLQDGELVAAAHEERFTRKKHDPDFPKKRRRSTASREAGITIARPRRRRLLRQAVREVRAHPAHVPRHVPALARRRFLEGDAGLAEGEALGPRATIRKELELRRADPTSPSTTSRTRRRRSCVSPFEEAAILTVDGVGEWATATHGRRPGNEHRADSARSASRTRSACSTARSPTTSASR